MRSGKTVRAIANNLLWAWVIAASVGIANASVHVANLRCEYLKNPLGVDEAHPRLSWILLSDERNQRQSAYQVLVGSEANKGDLWNSGKVSSNQSNQLEYNGTKLTAREHCYWKVRVWDSRGKASAWSETKSWTVGLLDQNNWHADWIGVAEPAKPKDEFATPRYLRREFLVRSKGIKRATVYATALGLYELHINGKRVGDHLLAPEWTDYYKRVQYQTFDVTKYLTTGRNAVAAIVGNGWYSGGWQHWESKLRTIYGDQPYLRVQLEIENQDGSRQTVSSGPAWIGTAKGPLRFAGIYEGETYDATRDMDGWDQPNFHARGWKPVDIAKPRVGQMEWQRSEPIRVTQFLKPIRVSEPKPGTYVFDLGQNIAGWFRFKLREIPNAQVTFQLNEVLNPDGTVYMDNLHAGHLSSGDRQVDRYVCRGGTEEFEPHFTYHGFRYVQVTGLHAKPSLNSLVGCVFHTGFVKTGSFECSNPLLNRLAQNIQWSQRANMMGVPTDCPQRDERCGYTGDAQFFVPTAVYNFDVAAFYNKWLVDVCEDSQLPAGFFADHAPTFGPGDHWNVGWSDAAILCPYQIWRAYGDTKVIRDHYDAMKRNARLLIRTSPYHLHTAPIGNGDWLNLGGGASPEFIGTAYDAYDLKLVSEMAKAIGQTEDAKEFAADSAKFTAALNREFVGSDGRLKDSSQTGYALAYTMGLLTEQVKPKVKDRFAEEIARFNDHLATGFIGTPRLLPALHLAGRDDLAYKLLLQRTYPSWLYQVGLGATTMWERWDGWTPEKGYQDSGMNSFNHYAFGSVGQYLFGMVGGIQEDAPGYKRILIAPVVRPGLTWAKVSYESIQGRIGTSWHKQGGRLILDIEVPVNTTARVFVPTMNPQSVSGDVNARGVTFLRFAQGSAVYQVGSGQYSFVSRQF